MRYRLAAIVVVLLLSVRISDAQSFDTSPDGRTGRVPFASYFNGDIDSINLYNGNLMLDITLFAQAGRELSTGLRLSYNSQKWRDVGYATPWGVYSGGWQIHSPAGGPFFLNIYLSSCVDDQGTWKLDAYWTDNLGTHHRYIGNDLISDCDQGNPPSLANLGLGPQTADGSALYTNLNGLPSILFKDGSIVDSTGSYSRLLTTNGNYLEQDSNGLPVHDTLGRTITYSTNRGSNTTPLCDYTPTSPVPYYKTYTVTDANGQPTRSTSRRTTYHQVTDSVEKIHFQKMSSIVRLVYDLGRRIADLDHAPVRDLKGARTGRGSSGKLQ